MVDCLTGGPRLSSLAGFDLVLAELAAKRADARSTCSSISKIATSYRTSQDHREAFVHSESPREGLQQRHLTSHCVRSQAWCY